MKLTEQLTRFFEIVPHNNPRVAGWYNPSMEVQVLVSAAGGEAVAGKNGVYSSNEKCYDWYNVRMPKNANSEPIDNDHDLRYPLDIHADSIGLTGWNWVDKKSVRIGFDYDSITGHAEGVGVSDEQLDLVTAKLNDIPQALVLRSTGGSGLHVYFEFDPENLPTTNNHTEHAALALACLKEISLQVGFDFQAGMDVGGGNMWVWAKRTTKESNGLTTIKDNVDANGQRVYLTPPANWEMYVDVANRKRTKVRIAGLSDSDQEDLEGKAAGQKLAFDDKHRQIISELTSYANYTTIVVSEHKLVQTHTRLLKELFDSKADSDDPILGNFNTNSTGKQPGQPNCFMFPLADGAFRVLRFGKGTNELPSWKCDKTGWTYCYYNQSLTLDGAASAFNALQDDVKGGGYNFPDGPSAISALRSMGHNIEIPDEIVDREVRLAQAKGGKLLVEISNKDPLNDKKDLPGEPPFGWLRKQGKFYKIFAIDVRSTTTVPIEVEDMDKKVRALISTDQKAAGWMVNHTSGSWISTNKDDSRSRLKAAGYGDATEAALGEAFMNAWTLVNIPFQDEFPGNRQWNLHAPTLKYKSEPYDPGVSPHPHWDMILEHVGKDLNGPLKELSWARKSGIFTGKDYLQCWIAYMIREPFTKLPYIYLWGNQCTGKSMLHEAIRRLMSGGYVSADSALTNTSDFNGELAGAVLCVVEEKNITKNAAQVYNKIKELVTSEIISIHAKYKQPVQQKNSTHWIQCANKRDSCPIFSGDTRVTMIAVEKFQVDEIPTHKMFEFLDAEAPYFMYTLMNTSLPDIDHRLKLPVVDTSSKEQLILANMSALESYISTNCFLVPGYSIELDILVDKFLSELSGNEKDLWDRQKVISNLPNECIIGKANGVFYIGNISYTPQPNNRPKLISKDGNLILASDGGKA
jgi:hypothetical protein